MNSTRSAVGYFWDVVEGIDIIEFARRLGYMYLQDTML